MVNTYKPKTNSIKINLEPGLYYLRVAGVTRKGTKGYYSSVRVIEIKPKKVAPPPPKVESVDVQDNKVVTRRQARVIAAVERGEEGELSEEDQVLAKKMEKDVIRKEEPEEGVKYAFKKSKARLKGLYRRAYWSRTARMYVPDN